MFDSIKSFFKRFFSQNSVEAEVSVNLLMPPVAVQYTNRDKRRKLLEWRDRHMAEMENSIKMEVSSLEDSVRKACSQMNKNDVGQIEEHYKNTIQPMFDIWITNTGKSLIESAIQDLPLAAVTSGSHHTAKSVVQNSENTPIKIDNYAGKAATALGVVSVPITASLATVSAGGIAGLLGATVIAWPVVAAGALIGGGLLLFNKWERKRSEYEKKLLDRIQAIAFKGLEGVEGSEGKKSLLQTLEQSIDDIASKLLKETKW